jgi:glycopeptide antibiotics resistance protein
MKKRLIAAFTFVIYSGILIKVMVFKSLPVIRVGHLMLRFGGTEVSGTPNFVPFKTILPYLLGYKGWIIAGVNLFGNIGLLVPVGLLALLVWPNLSWKKSLILAVASGFTIELLQVVFHVGIFDVDDVILNALGVMIGYGVLKIIFKLISQNVSDS